MRARSVVCTGAVAVLGVLSLGGVSAAEVNATPSPSQHQSAVTPGSASSDDTQPRWGRLVRSWEAAPDIWINYYQWDNTSDYSISISGAGVRPGMRVEGHAPNGFPYQDAIATVPPNSYSASTEYFTNTMGLFARVYWANGDLGPGDPNNIPA